MTLPASMNANGFLFTRRRPAGRHVDWTVVEGLRILEVGLPGWIAMALTSQEPLLKETLPTIDDHFVYYYLCRAGHTDRFLLLSTDPELVSTLLVRAGVSNEFSSPRIDTATLARTLVEKPARYAMSAVWGRIDGYGNSLRTAAFYGHDLGEALLFVQLLPHLSAYRVALRDTTRRTEVLSAGSKGEIYFRYEGISSLRDADRALKFLSTRGFLAWNSEDESSVIDGGSA